MDRVGSANRAVRRHSATSPSAALRFSHLSRSPKKCVGWWSAIVMCALARYDRSFDQFSNKKPRLVRHLFCDSTLVTRLVEGFVLVALFGRSSEIRSDRGEPLPNTVKSISQIVRDLLCGLAWLGRCRKLLTCDMCVRTAQTIYVRGCEWRGLFCLKHSVDSDANNLARLLSDPPV
jgi:hypothetical protein